MYFRPRHRHGAYPLAREHTLPRSLRFLLAAGAILFAAYLLWTLMLRIFGITGSVERAGAMLSVEDRGTVTVTIDGADQRATSGMMVFPGESVTTSAGARASLQFFDGTRTRLNDATTLTIAESAHGESNSRIRLTLTQGNLWMMTAPVKSFSGSVTRSVTSPTLSFELPAGTEAALSPTTIAVFATDGDGVTVELEGEDPFVISEGQQWTMPAGGVTAGTVLDSRAPLDPLAARSTFVVESRQKFLTQTGTAGSASSRSENTGILTVTAPVNGLVLLEPALTVQGTISADVTAVTVNGYPAVVDIGKATFSQQVSPPEGQGEFEITVQALAADRTILAEAHRTIRRAPPGPLAAPTVTVPAKTGQTYATDAVELILRGGAPAGAAGILVNDYKLQLFDPAKGEWSYVASLRLNNMVPGTNVYNVYAIDATGKKSEPATITIIQGAGSEGIITGPSSAASSTATSSGPLPTNAPLEPGSLTVIAPTAGTTHSETGTGFLLEGLTSAKTASVWVNDYRLQLYRAGKTTWNYIVDVNFNNLKRGKNTYVIVARNAKDEIVDQMTYTVEYEPK